MSRPRSGDRRDIALALQAAGLAPSAAAGRRLLAFVLDSIVDKLKTNGRCELRGFGVFVVKPRPPRRYVLSPRGRVGTTNGGVRVVFHRSAALRGKIPVDARNRD